MSRRDAKIELIRTQILIEIERVQNNTTTPGRAVTKDARPAYLGGLRRALESAATSSAAAD